eukprot:TRINITY_DN363_c0_g1_i11.p1 TRINITY_DN363_c0_g1~~TRINITY_DN363_c0_g1_i11.p1  ORF type:complete len:284 (+),score=76.74 TRINITY_DN363_c0_g1_i11:726-1577(+)
MRQTRLNPSRMNVEACCRIGYTLALLVWAGVTFGQDAEAPVPVTFEPAIKPEQMKTHIEFLASPEMSGRSGAAKKEARRYIIEQWKKAGLQPLFPGGNQQGDDSKKVPVFEQPIPGNAGEDGRIPILGYNIGAWIPGSDPKLAHEIVIVSAHYDHLGMRDGEIFAGADDNASGVAMMIEVARLAAADKVRCKRSLVFVGFDLEERMLWGSRWFAAHPPWPIERVKLFITADMIGRSLGSLPLPVVFVMGSERAHELRTALDLVEIGRAVQQECRDRSRMPSSA